MYGAISVSFVQLWMYVLCKDGFTIIMCSCVLMCVNSGQYKLVQYRVDFSLPPYFSLPRFAAASESSPKPLLLPHILTFYNHVKTSCLNMEMK